jgi:protein SCO1/2
MTKKALLALCLAILLPLAGYFFMKYKSDNAVVLPPKYIFDTVITKVVNGQAITDTLWHTVKNIRLVNQLGDSVNLHDIHGKAIVADFIFTHCGSICPYLTHNMAKMQQSFFKGGDTRNKIDTSVVQFLSFSIDPDRDSVSVLKRYADAHKARHDNWWFLTGNRDSIYKFIFEELKVDKYTEAPVDSTFAHTSRFVLIDKNYHIRGFYNGLDTVESLQKLARDIGLLMLEKDNEHPAALPFDPVEAGIALLLTVVIVVTVFSIVKKKTL